MFSSWWTVTLLVTVTYSQCFSTDACAAVFMDISLLYSKVCIMTMKRLKYPVNM